MDLVRACDGISPLHVEEKALTGPLQAPHDNAVQGEKGFYPLPVDEKKSVSWCWRALEMSFSPCPSKKRPSRGLGVRLRWAFPLCLSRKRPSHGLGVRLRWTVPPACQGKGSLMDLVCAFLLCLSRKRSYHGLGVRLRWTFPPACRGKGSLMDLVCACDGLYPLSVVEKGIQSLFHLQAVRKGILSAFANPKTLFYSSFRGYDCAFHRKTQYF